MIGSSLGGAFRKDISSKEIKETDSDLANSPLIRATKALHLSNFLTIGVAGVAGVAKAVGNFDENMDERHVSERHLERRHSAITGINESADIRSTPKEHGHWKGERGNSKWCPDLDYIPPKTNPESKTWGEIFAQYKIDEGFDFKNGDPSFQDISQGDVKIWNFSAERADNFDKADIELAKQQGCSPDEIRDWRKKHHYTWHECRDMTTMQKVPSEVHNNVSHRGGISNAKALELRKELS